MRRVEVEAVEDRSRAEGGHAVIILRGIGKSVGDARFDLRPALVDQDEPAAREPSLTGLEPLHVRDTEDGLALYLGPEITQNAAFVPGSAVEITLPAAGVSGEFLWPAVTPVVRPKRRNIMTRRSAPDPLVRPSRPAEEPPASGKTVATPAQPTVPTVEPVEAERSERTVVRPQPSEGTVPAARRPIVLTSSFARRPLASEETAELPPDLPADSKAGRLDETLRAESTPAHPRIEADRLAEPPQPVARPVARPATSDTPAPVVTPVVPVTAPPMQATAVAEAPGRTTEAERPALAVSKVSPDPVPDPVPLPAPAAPSAPARRGLSTAAAVALAVVGVAAAQFVALRVFDLSLVPRRQLAAIPAGQPNAPATVSAPAQVSPAPSIKPARLAEPPLPTAADIPAVYDVIAVGPRSPRGVAADDVTSGKALELAQGLLHGGEGKRDPEEAAFWLKRYLASAQGSENIRIALTQLGSAYAQPVDGKRDFGRAQIVWELASALGDPVAMCFLGAMHEHGLGRPSSSATAATWYERAGALGRRCASAQRAEAAPGR